MLILHFMFDKAQAVHATEAYRHFFQEMLSSFTADGKYFEVPVLLSLASTRTQAYSTGKQYALFQPCFIRVIREASSSFQP